MTLAELSKCYEDSAVLLRKRLHELRNALAASQDPEEVWHIKRRIADLTPMLTQMNELAWMLVHYYEIGGSDHDSRYGFNGKRKAKSIKPKADDGAASDTRRRINRFAEADLSGISLRKEDHNSNRGGTRSEQKHHLQNPEANGSQNNEMHQVCPDISQFFLGTPKRHRRRIT